MTELQDPFSYGLDAAKPSPVKRLAELETRVYVLETVLEIVAKHVGISPSHPSFQPPPAGTVDA